jgi:hypothetical protein
MTTTTPTTHGTVRRAPTIIALVAGLALGAGSTMLAERDEANRVSPTPGAVVAPAPAPGPIADAKDHPNYGRTTSSGHSALDVTDAKDHPNYRRTTSSGHATLDVTDAKDHPNYRRPTE